MQENQALRIFILIWNIWYLKAFFIKRWDSDLLVQKSSQLLRNLRQKGCKFKGILGYRVSSAWLAWTI